MNDQFNLTAICLLLVRMVGWLNSGAPALAIWYHLKSEILSEHFFDSQKVKIKIKSRLLHLFLKKVPEKHIIIFFGLDIIFFTCAFRLGKDFIDLKLK